MLILVSLDEQLARVYRNGIEVATTTVSSGRPGYPIPTGVFTILQKARVHHSSTYDEASMPLTERLTWDGVALHAGGVPGYPSSHGCVHLPLAFAQLPFEITGVGTTVVIADAHSAPQEIVHPGLILPTTEIGCSAGRSACSSASPTAAATPTATASRSAPPPPRSPDRRSRCCRACSSC
jgi:hypothetical protein